MKKVVKTNHAPAPIGPYSQAIVSGNLMYVSGQIAIDPLTGGMIQDSIAAETGRIMENIGAILIEAGMDYANIIKTSIFLTDLNDFAVVNDTYGSYFSKDFPARETVEVSKLPKGARVEISVVAAG
ncbi:MAG TPA: RidA family protein [Bacteroidia bacterium]|nr:RidA family protein [Bacteroidia bacterium]